MSIFIRALFPLFRPFSSTMVDVIPSSISVCSQIFNTAVSANNVKLILIPSPTTSSFNPEVCAASPDQDIHAPLDLSCKSGTRKNTD